MNEIDDTYKQETEDLDTEFVESHNLGKTKGSTISKYLSGIKKSKNKFINDYVKYNKREKWKLKHPKKKKKKQEKQKYLRIKHFDFKHNAFEKLAMRLDLIFFNIGRFFSKTFAIITPRIVIYVFYKISKTIKAFFRDAGYFVDRKKANIIASLKRWIKQLIEKSKKKITKFKELLSELMSKLGKKDKEGEDDKKDSKDDKKDSDDKDDKKS